MKITMAWSVVAAVLAAAAPARAAGKLRVVTTTTELAAIARAVGGDRVEVKSIGDGTQDPHFIEPKPSTMVIARNADLWIRVGMELEIGYEGIIIDGSRNPKIRLGTPGHLDASEKVLKLEVPDRKIDRSEGDVHPQGNPHYWLDPWNGRVMAGEIAARLSSLDPDHRTEYEKNLTAFRERLDRAAFGEILVKKIGGDRLWAAETGGALDAFLETEKSAGELGGWFGILRPYRGRKMVMYHRSWTYFNHRFGFTSVAELEPKPGIPPGPGHLAEVIRRVKAEDAAFLLKEPFYEKKGPAFVEEKTGLRVVEAANTVNGEPGVADYPAVFDNLVRKVAAVLASAK
ncbi:MAG: metal ABC transporter substrate-binding protein [Planctomycetota bacterium]